MSARMRSLALIFVAIVTSALAAPQWSHAATPPSDLPEYRQEPIGCFRFSHMEDVDGNGTPESPVYDPYATLCPQLSDSIDFSVRGFAFEDLNANGKFDSGEQTISFAYFKLTDGGSYYRCGYVGNDGTFGIPVNDGNYILMPIAPPGYRTTTPYIRTMMTNVTYGYASNPMGFVKDPNAKLDACDQYNPPRSGTSS